MGEPLDALIYVGGVAITAVVTTIVVLSNIEKAQAGWGRVLGLFSWVGGGIRRRSISNTIQGDIDRFSRAVDNEVRGVMPYNVKIDFVREADQAELRDQRTVIVRIRDRKGDERNLVHAALAFCPIGLLPQARSYLCKELALAMDVTVTRKLMNHVGNQGALNYLHNDVLPTICEGQPDVNGFCTAFDVLDENGLFTRVILREFRDFGAKMGTRYPSDAYAHEAKDFVKYVHKVAEKEYGEALAQVGYRGSQISTAFVFVGIGDRIAAEGAVPYLKHMEWLRGQGFERALLAARGSQQIDMARRVSYLSEKREIAKRIREDSYRPMGGRGRGRDNCLIEMRIIAKA